MLIWIILFLIVMAVSFVLAIRSMDDYQEEPLGTGLYYSPFLIQNPQKLTAGMLEDIHNEARGINVVIALEKLFKGTKEALVIFAPRELADKFSTDLNLLELEDYSLKKTESYKVWELSTKNLLPVKLPKLLKKEEFWWQIILKPKTGHDRQCKEKNIYFQTLVRAVFFSEKSEKEAEIGKSFGVIPLPQAYSNAHLLKFYQQRVLPLGYIKELGEGALSTLSTEQVLALLAVKEA